MSRLPPLFSAVLAQLLALLLVKLLAPVMPELPLARLLLQGSLAAMAGRLLRLPYWWVPINLLLPLGAAVTLSLNLPPWLFLLVFIALLLIQWNSGAEQVPLYLSNRKTWRRLEQLIAAEGQPRFIDLGSGLGGALLYLARRFPDGEFTGIESAPLPFVVAWLRFRLSGQKNLRLRYGSLWSEELSGYNIVYAFLSPVPMERLYRKLEQELPDGGLLISNSFTVPGKEADEVVAVEDRRQTRLYCFRFNSVA